MPKPGDVVTVDFPSAAGLKRRPAVVVSSDAYHTERPDIILDVLTTNVSAATTATDHVLHDWQSAGLRAPSAFRSYFGMALPSAVHVIGRLSDPDWNAIRACVKRAFA